MGTGGGTLIGAVFSHMVRGFGIGLASSAAYYRRAQGPGSGNPRAIEYALARRQYRDCPGRYTYELGL